MKTTFIRYFLICLCMPIFSGCFTYTTASKTTKQQTESFYPQTLYKSEVDGGVALEGTWTNHRAKSYHAFLMIPEKTLVEAHRNTGGDVTFTDLCALSPGARQTLQVKKELPPNYQKVCDFPKSQGDVTLNESTKVRVSAVAALPFALVIDVATLPLQVIALHNLSEIQ